jgi:hypothetical protein
LWELTHFPKTEHIRYGGEFGTLLKTIQKAPILPLTAPENILVMVAGGSGLYSMVMPNWGGAATLMPPSVSESNATSSVKFQDCPVYRRSALMQTYKEIVMDPLRFIWCAFLSVTGRARSYLIKAGDRLSRRASRI